jgi:hypothetical protein
LFEHLEREDLANLRLICRNFSTRATPPVFKSITTSFGVSTFTKPSRVKALSRIGHHIKTFTFHMPHSPDTFLPPIMDPMTEQKRVFNYEPQLQDINSGPANRRALKYGTEEMQDLLVKQYPPLFHAATNVPAFVAVFSQLTNLTHLRISCPRFYTHPCNCPTTVGYALISLRIAIERAPLYSLSSLSFDKEHCTLLVDHNQGTLHPSMRDKFLDSPPLRFARLKYIDLEDVVDGTPIATSIHNKHHCELVASNLENIKLHEGGGDDAPEPPTNTVLSNNWGPKHSMEVPIMLLSDDAEQWIMGSFPRRAIESPSASKSSYLSRWLIANPRGPLRRRPVAKDIFPGGAYIRRLLGLSPRK